MGLAYAELILANPREPELQPLAVRALADSGSLHLCIPEHVAIQLQLQAQDQREVTIADGSRRVCAYAGPVEVRFDGRRCYTGALILGEEVLLGSVPMEDMDLVISPAQRAVTVNPNSPNIPSSIVKRGA
ncbi:MAG TPA: clan AA aspartic protease [Thermoanaerobaculia bacterium]|nr:clan AA aspartic protease [Thermoanaerobaculia bacterium]